MNHYKSFISSCLNDVEALTIADVNETNANNGMTPLMYACKYGNEECVTKLLESRADVNRKDRDGFTAIMYSLAYEYIPIFYILKEVQDIELDIPNEYGFTPLMCASQLGELNIVRILIEAKANVNSTDINGNTPMNHLLRWSSFSFDHQSLHAECLQLLINSSASITMKNKNGMTPLLLASKHGKKECLHLLIKARASLCDMDDTSTSALNYAARKGYPSVLQMLLESKCSIENDIYSSLAYAVLCNELECCKILIEHKSNINICLTDDTTPLFYAVNQGHTDCVRFLIDKKADLNVQDKDGKTLCMHAIRFNEPSVLRILLDNRADVNIQSKKRRTALSYAMKYENPECMTILFELNPEIDIGSLETMCDNFECISLLRHHRRKRVLDVLLDILPLPKHNGHIVLFQTIINYVI